MKLFFRLLGIWLLFGCVQAAWPQTTAGPKVDRVDIKYNGPKSVSDFITACRKLRFWKREDAVAF